jgi:hypothetical protein
MCCDLRIGDAPEHTFAKIVVGVEARQVDQGGVLARDERRHAMKKKVLQPWDILARIPSTRRIRP